MNITYDGSAFVVLDADREFTHRLDSEFYIGGSWRDDAYRVPDRFAPVIRLSCVTHREDWDKHAQDRLIALHTDASMRAKLSMASTPPAGFKYQTLSTYELTDIQAAGAGWLSSTPAAMLCDEMGSGKTVQVCAALAELNVESALIVCPRTVVPVWSAHLLDLCDMLAWPLVGSAAERKRNWRDFSECQMKKALIVPWSVIAKHAKVEHWSGTTRAEHERLPGDLNQDTWPVAVFDEAHRAKDPTAKQTRAAWSIDAERRWALTGTPLANSPNDFWSVLRLVDPESWRSRIAFQSEFCDMQYSAWKYNRTDVAGWRGDRLERLHSVVAPVYRRRSMEEAIGRKIDRVRKMLIVQLNRKHREQYDRIEADWIIEHDGQTSWSDSALTATTRLCQAAAAQLAFDEDGNVEMHGPSPKAAALREFLDDLPPGEKVVVFSASRQLLHITKDLLERHKYRTSYLIGGMTATAAEDSLRDWRDPCGSQVLLATYGAGAEGITLTESRIVVHLQSDWSMVHRMQAEDRVRRWTQDASAVLVVDIVSENTIDERILRAQQTKRDMLDQISPADLVSAA